MPVRLDKNTRSFDTGPVSQTAQPFILKLKLQQPAASSVPGYPPHTPKPKTRKGKEDPLRELISVDFPAPQRPMTAQLSTRHESLGRASCMSKL